MGHNLNLSPVFIISSLAMWGMVWGIPGMFLAVPILAIITIILSQFPKTRPAAILMSKTGVLRDH
jgi:predicted PurR-regulated permease PerM